MMMSQVHEEEAHRLPNWTRMYVEVRVKMEVPFLISGPVNIEQQTRGVQPFNREVEPFGIVQVHEIFSSSQVKESSGFDPLGR